MPYTNTREVRRKSRHRRLRKRIAGMPERLRLSLYRSTNHLFAQIVDDVAGKTLLGCSTKDERLKLATGGNISAAEALGKLIAVEATSKGIKQVVFDRGGYVYHGRVKAFADAVRAGGLQV